MRHLLMNTAAAALLGAIGVVSVSTVDAAQSSTADTNGSHMGSGMPNGARMAMHDGMMAQMSQLMEGCNAMMQQHNQTSGQQSVPPSVPRGQ